MFLEGDRMEAYIYGDIVFLINLIMNFFILLFTGKIAKQKIHPLRYLLGAALGSFYVVVSFLPSFRFLNMFTGKLLFSFVMIAATFFPYHLLDFLKIAIYFYIVSFLVGGGAFAMFNLMGKTTAGESGIFYTEPSVPLWATMVSLLLIYLFFRFGIGYIKRFFTEESLYMDLRLTMNQKECSVTALIDTGNSLLDPISKKPVIVVEYEVVKGLLPPELTGMMREDKELDMNHLYLSMEILSRETKFRIIPFSAMGTKSGLLLGFKPDKVECKVKGKNRELPDVIIGIFNGMFTKNERYRALVGPEALRL